MYSIWLSKILKVRSEKRSMSFFRILKYLEINKLYQTTFPLCYLQFWITWKFLFNKRAELEFAGSNKNFPEPQNSQSAQKYSNFSPLRTNLVATHDAVAEFPRPNKQNNWEKAKIERSETQRHSWAEWLFCGSGKFLLEEFSI